WRSTGRPPCCGPVAACEPAAGASTRVSPKRDMPKEVHMAEARANAQLKILFIGNSFTARNNLPDLIAQLAPAPGKRIEHRLISAGGASLRRHWNAGEAPRAIQDGHYDYVVLQEQSTLPIQNAKRMRENVQLFDEAIKQAGGRTILYMTWARRNAPQ